MHTIGVIAEYNPFHSGHGHHLRMLSQTFGPDCAVAVSYTHLTRTVTLDDGSTRSGLVCYSLGNFVSNQSPATVNVNYTDTTAILNLELTKDPATGETTVSNINYVPLLVLNRGANVQDRYIILDVNAAIAEYKAGNTTTVSDAVYQKLEYALEGCHTILGEKYDTAGSPPAGSAA